MSNSTRDRIANIGADMVPTYHATESVEEAKAVVEQCRSATEELRRLLDERGVKWDYGITGATTTRFSVNGIDLTFTPMRDGLVCSTILTPEQAIAATLGAVTCHAIISDNLTESEGMGDAWADCSECGHLLFVLTDPNSEPPNFCPNCGKRVINE